MEEIVDEIQINDLNKKSYIKSDAEEQWAHLPKCFVVGDNKVLPAADHSIVVFCSLQNQYYNGTVTHISNDKIFTNDYDDGDIENLSDMSKENWRF